MIARKMQMIDAQQRDIGGKAGNHNLVSFMAAYDLQVKSKRRVWRKKAKASLAKYNLDFMMTHDTMLTPIGGLKYSTTYDYIGNKISYEFNTVKPDARLEDFKEYIDKSGWCLELMLSARNLLSSNYYGFSFFFGIKSFLAYFGADVYQVDSIAYVMNSTYFVNFELINYESGKNIDPLDLVGKSNDFNIRPVKGYSFFDDDFTTLSDKKISDIIVEWIMEYLGELTDGKLEYSDWHYVHNTLILSNSIKKVDEFAKNRLQIKEMKGELIDISTVDAYKYFVFDSFGLVTSYGDDMFQQAMRDSLILESLKEYIYLSRINNIDQTTRLSETKIRQFSLDISLFVPNVPILTHNYVGRIMNTETYLLQNQAYETKTAYLSLLYEKRKEKNALRLNVLLYILSLVGIIDALSTLEEKWGLQFTPSLIVALIFFLLLGWLIFSRDGEHK